jgi:hypothetical protein
MRYLVEDLSNACHAELISQLISVHVAPKRETFINRSNASGRVSSSFASEMSPATRDSQSEDSPLGGERSAG